jgi:2,3-bisphosphoglycerate-dependent phosphoglycerate mutase
VPDLVLLRHGASEGNVAGTFTGWLDPDLSPSGELDSVRAAELLRAAGLSPDVAHTSLMRRATRTTDIVLATLGRVEVPVHPDWRLNERHYGALQGRRRRDVLAEIGEATYDRWRRSYDARPPALADAADQLAALAPPGVEPPRTESLADVVARLEPWWAERLILDLDRHGCVLVVAHSNSLRALIKRLDRISDDAVDTVNVAIGIPLHYRLTAGTLAVEGSAYLDPAAASVDVARVAAEGRAT